MDLKTVMLLLAVGSYLLGLLLIFLRYKKSNPQKIPFWIEAKLLQGTGSLLLYFRTGVFDGLTLVANIMLLLGGAYEAWAVRVLCRKPVPPRFHLSLSAAIICAGVASQLMVEPYRLGFLFLLQSILYFLTSLFLLCKPHIRRSLQLILSGSYCFTGGVFLLNAILCLGFPDYAQAQGSDVIFSIIPLATFFIFLASGFILLMLAKEKSDQLAWQMEKSLLETERRFQRIVETAIEGILILDPNYMITFANPKMASALGYYVEQIIGRSFISLFPPGDLAEQKYTRFFSHDDDTLVYECRLLRRDGRKHWFLVSAKAVYDEEGHLEGYVAMLTDIHERKEMELMLEESNRLLAELSNTDGLTGIANRRCFDATLESEYLRLKRTNSKLSVILLDIDYFKEFNDCYGHVSGDECLRRIGKVLTGSVTRSLDLAARYGGEEFACILPDTDLTGAVHVAERIRQRIHGLQIEHKKSPVAPYVTASFGVTTVQYSPDKSLADIIAAADKLLYKAKASGRDRIEFAELSG